MYWGSRTKSVRRCTLDAEESHENKLVERNSRLNLSKKLSKNCGGFEKLRLDDFFSSEWHSLSPSPYIYDLKKISIL